MDAKGFRVGTCGFSYPEWREAFYPKDLAQAEYLRFYSLVFPFVELEASWRTMPKRELLESLARQTPSEFLFSLKAHKSLTHEISKDWGKNAERFSLAVEALASRGKLAAVLLQFPHRFAYTTENRIYLGELCSVLSSFPLAIDFRDTAWRQPSAFEGFAKRNIAFVMVESPNLPDLALETAPITADTIYCRLYGRNDEQWWDGSAQSRYGYDYSPQELRDKARFFIGLAQKAEKIFVAFNNHAEAKAAKNARALGALIKELYV